MSMPVAILLAALIVAGALIFISHWSVQPVSGRVGTVRLNGWTGDVVWCGFTGTSTPSYLDCRVDDEWAPVPSKQ
jgi:hypothetical protein